jgi:hypothetical protein
VKSWVGLTWIGAGGEEDAVIDKLMEKSAKLNEINLSSIA